MTNSAHRPNLPVRGEKDVETRHPIVVRDATSPKDIDQVRSLFMEYAVSLGFSLCFQDFDEEVKNLPGAYKATDRQTIHRLRSRATSWMHSAPETGDWRLRNEAALRPSHPSRARLGKDVNPAPG